MAFLDEDFLLTTPAARILYHDYAESMPILDYHCHLSPQEIYENRGFETLTQVWLGGDHYKWRLLRAAGVGERYITGDAPEREKFQKYAEVLSRAIGNPLYHWSHLELKRYFGFDGVLGPDVQQSSVKKVPVRDGVCLFDGIQIPAKIPRNPYRPPSRRYPPGSSPSPGSFPGRRWPSG